MIYFRLLFFLPVCCFPAQSSGHVKEGKKSFGVALREKKSAKLGISSGGVSKMINVSSKEQTAISAAGETSQNWGTCSALVNISPIIKLSCSFGHGKYL